LPPNELAHALNERTKAVLPDNYAVLLRCYDPRVLPEIKAILNEDQARRFWALDGQWGYVDRTRIFRLIGLTPASEAAHFEAPLTLSQAQADQLLAAAEVDTVMPELVRESPDAFLALPLADRAAFTRRTLRMADQFELASLADRVMFCVLTLELGAGFESKEQWAPLMDKVKRHQLTLLQAIQQATRP
jgi:5-carboxymethyl-2-hydroxymuconate isomerase